MGWIHQPSDNRSRQQRLIEAKGGQAKFLAWWESFDFVERVGLQWDWEFFGRAKQLPPPGDWETWHLRAGRGFGKTLTGAQWIRWKVEREGCGNLGIVAPTAADARDVMIEGPSGILAVCPPWRRPVYEPSKRRITWPNGAQVAVYSAEEPDRLRGPQHEAMWCDELAAWQQLDDTWNMLQFGMRMGTRPQVLITSTPRGLKFLRDLEAEPNTVTVLGSTYENQENLAAKYIKRIRDKYEGTRLGLQEIEAQILDDNPGALWKRGLIDAKRLTVAGMVGLGVELRRVVVALDPATTSTAKSCEAGIVAVGMGMCRCQGKPAMHGFVLEDASDILTPTQTIETILDVYDRRQANTVVGETNQGGDWIEALLRIHERGKDLPYRGIHAKDGKRLRADPVAALYEQGKVHHVGSLPKLEDEMCSWDPGRNDDSPDRIDALVHGLTHLLVQPAPAPYSASSGGGWHPRR
jgi:phage terminase large subunit-like protein